MKTPDLDSIITLYRQTDADRIPGVSTDGIVAAVRRARTGSRSVLKWAIPFAAAACLAAVLLAAIPGFVKSRTGRFSIDITNSGSSLLTSRSERVTAGISGPGKSFNFTSRDGKNVSIKL